MYHPSQITGTMKSRGTVLVSGQCAKVRGIFAVVDDDLIKTGRAYFGAIHKRNA
jgi:orotate phosphoribosyltransferase-like protein